MTDLFIFCYYYLIFSAFSLFIYVNKGVIQSIIWDKCLARMKNKTDCGNNNFDQNQSINDKLNGQ